MFVADTINDVNVAHKRGNIVANGIGYTKGEDDLLGVGDYVNAVCILPFDYHTSFRYVVFGVRRWRWLRR
jgi:hypothetical protein